MKKAIWSISVFFDDEKTRLMFTRDYENVKHIKEDFQFSKTFLYNSCRSDKYFEGSRKTPLVSRKYNRIKIEKKTYRKNGTFELTKFG